MNSILAELINGFVYVLELLILARCIISWFPVGRDNPIISLLYTLTEPILEPVRNLLEKSSLGGSGMMLDFSPIVAMIFIQVVRGLLIGFLR